MATDYVADCLDRVVSTQDEARRRFGGMPHLVVAAAQDAGRGRGGAPWLNAPRALAASLAFVPSWPPAQVPLLTLMAGLAAYEVLGPDVWLKWPNDVVTSVGDKLAGLLSEFDGEVVVVGFGANLYWPDAPAGIAARFTEDPGPDCGPELAHAWTLRLLAAADAGPAGWDRAAYSQRCLTVGETITWGDAGRGEALGIDEAGGLIVATASGRRVLRSGTVHGVRPTTLSTDPATDSGG